MPIIKTISSNNTLNNTEKVNCNMLDNQIRAILYLIQRLMQASEYYNKELEKKHKLSIPQLNCLLALHEKGPMPLSVIAQHIMVNSSTVTGIIDRLEEKGILYRSRISQDRRVVTVLLTDSGTLLAQNAPPPLQPKIVAGLKKLSSTGREEIIEALSKLIHMLDIDNHQ